MAMSSAERQANYRARQEREVTDNNRILLLILQELRLLRNEISRLHDVTYPFTSYPKVNLREMRERRLYRREIRLGEKEKRLNGGTNK